MEKEAVEHIRIKKIRSKEISFEEDLLACEEPLEILIKLPGTSEHTAPKTISITMRTPGADSDLALGFLFTEGILTDFSQVAKVAEGNNSTLVTLKSAETVDLSKLERHFYTSSSCGVCGKTSIDFLRLAPKWKSVSTDWKVSSEVLQTLPAKLRDQQAVFERTGGLHAAALFSNSGELLQLCEDIGRHNALDKLIGQAFQNDTLPLEKYLLLLSGRASFELIQKAVMAGIPMVAAVGAPSNLAVELAKEFNISLIGFLKRHGFNIYNEGNCIEI
ncbi:formate dehydrogenase accessory sulfurtransferase FdhD [Poritiphilus flavus]|uniref:Sulfur carrier protein FdhD n=1 Tax=Poritiphilus flavus TaxID=2697053 RepID=A0A6L9EF69_9FLAO|nr:formate dehydrogenase accessory sulfurtransferase FdhD [Poritiphilus flavus]NAS13377.1 formate dehydrogenase accessory sulfurtransferase FdhD [Poritiphilus flavus]